MYNYYRSGFRYIFMIIVFFMLIDLCAFHNLYASEIVIGVKLNGAQEISINNMMDIFIKNGYIQEKSVIFEGMIFSKVSKKNIIVILKADILHSNDDEKLFFDVADARTGLESFFEVYKLSYKEKNSDFSKRIGEVIFKIEQLNFDKKSCEKLIVAVDVDEKLQGEFENLYLDLRKKLFAISHVSLVSRNKDLNNAIINLQNYLASNIGIYKPNRSIKGKMCPINIWCRMIYDKENKSSSKLQIRNAFKNEILKEINLTSKKDIDKIISEILKHKKSDFIEEEL